MLCACIVAPILATATTTTAQGQGQARPRPSSDGGRPGSTDLSAREHFRQGVGFARDDDWANALAAFERAHGLDPRPAIALNIATAQAQLGRLKDARATYRDIVDAEGDVPASVVRAARDALSRLAERIPRLSLTVSGHRDQDACFLDENRLEAGTWPGELEVDPGRHSLHLERGGRIITQAHVTAIEGQVTHVALAAPELDAAIDPHPLLTVQSTELEGPSIWSSPWLWIGAGAAVVAAVVAVLLLSGSSDPGSGTPSPTEPFVGTFRPGSVRLP